MPHQLDGNSGRVHTHIPNSVTIIRSRHELVKEFLGETREWHARGKDQVEYNAIMVVSGVQATVQLNMSPHECF